MFKPKPVLPFESYKSGINRVYTFLYSRIQPEKVPGYIPLSANQKLLTSEQKQVFQSLLARYKNSTNSFREEDFAKEILGFESVSDLSKAIRDVEAPGTEVIDPLSNNPVIAQSYAGGFHRFLPILFSSERTINYRQNWERNICTFQHGANPNLPIVSLSEKRCIVVLSNKDNLALVHEEMKLVYGDTIMIEPGFPYLVVKPEFLPLLNEKPTPYTQVHASKLMSLSYVKDAFEQNGVIEIQPDLARTISQEYPRFWNKLSWVLVKSINDIRGINLFGDRFIFVGDDSPYPINTYVNLSTLQSLDSIYGFDLKTSLQLRTQYPEVWKRSIEDPNYDLFMGLFADDQFLLASIQYLQFIKNLRYEPKEAINVYKENLRSKEVQNKFLLEVPFNEQNTYRKVFTRI